MYNKSKKRGIGNIFLTKSHFNKYTRLRNKKRRNNKKRKWNIKILFLILFIIILLYCVRFIIYKFNNKSNNKFNNNFDNKYKYQQDDLTIVSAYYKIKSKYNPEYYYQWIRNFALLNRSMVFFSSKEFMTTFKEYRPKELYYKTVFIELEMEDFFAYKNFYNEFQESFKIDHENSYHTVPLYIIWAEKATFLKKAILSNYFQSKCFFWIDAGYFRDPKEMPKYINWPSTKKCLEDDRLLLGQIRGFSDEAKKGIINFDKKYHEELKRNINVSGNLFGGQIKNTLKFINLYYEAIRLFIKNKIFIGKDQNIFTYVAFAHPEVVKLIKFNYYYDFKFYLS